MWQESTDTRDNDQVRKDYITLRVIARELCHLADSTFQTRQEFEHKGFPYFHYMIGTMTMCQIHYLEDILSLTPNRSVEVIARTMVEGFLKVKWVAESPQVRAHRWFSFAWVQEWKYLKRNEDRDVYTSDEKSQLLERLRTDAKVHFTRRGRKRNEDGKEPDPFSDFQHDWTGKGMYHLASQFGLQKLYAKFYDPYNDWVHWSSKGLLKTSEASDEGASFSFISYYQSVTALIAGITSLLGCLKMATEVFNKDSKAEIAPIESAFSPWNPV